MASSTPIIDFDSRPNSLLVNLERIQSNFPTPQTPINTPLSQSSISSPACAPISLHTHLACKRLLPTFKNLPQTTHPHTFTKTHNPHSYARKNSAPITDPHMTSSLPPSPHRPKRTLTPRIQPHAHNKASPGVSRTSPGIGTLSACSQATHSEPRTHPTSTHPCH